MQTSHNYSVNLWGSHPDEENDDCHTGTDYDSFEEAMAAYQDVENCLLVDASRRAYYADWAYVEITGPDGIGHVRMNPLHNPERKRREQEADDREWQREQANQAGMAFGCDGYNDVMGY